MLKNIKLVALTSVVIGCIGIPALHAAWVEDGIAVCTMNGVQDLPVLVTDGSGGAIVAWRDERVINTDIYAQRIDADGNILWPGTAMPICTAPNAQSDPVIVPDDAGGAIVAWQDSRSGSVLEIYIQRINSDGYIQWQAQGVPVCTEQNGCMIGQMISDGAGGAFIAWHDRRNFTNYVFVQKIGADGAARWTVNGVSVCALYCKQEYPALAADGTGGAIIAWQDSRNGASDIYAQRIDAAGTVRWGSNGIAVCTSGQVQRYARIIPDGSGGAIIVWEDKRNTIDYDLFAQRIDADGALQWAASGVAIAATMYDQMSCRLAPVGTGLAMVVWIDYRGGAGTSDIYAQKIDTGGACQWTSNGIAVCGAAGNQRNVRLVPNGSGGAIATWEDERSGAGTYDLYAQRIDAGGAAGWTAEGLAVCRAAADQITPQLAPDEWGGASFTWMDERSGVADIYNQKIDAAGDIGTATSLRSYSAVTRGSEIMIEWTLSEMGEDVDFFIFRAEKLCMTFDELIPADIRRDGMSFAFVDMTCAPGTTYHYRVDVRDGDERRILFETGPIDTPAMTMTLDQNTPNPFNPSTTIRYDVPGMCRVVLEIFNAGGESVRRLADRYMPAGTYTAVWDGCDGTGKRVSSGVYFYRLTAGKKALSRKMVLLR